jgi:hypothetical protein
MSLPSGAQQQHAPRAAVAVMTIDALPSHLRRVLILFGRLLVAAEADLLLRRRQSDRRLIALLGQHVADHARDRQRCVDGFTARFVDVTRGAARVDPGDTRVVGGGCLCCRRGQRQEQPEQNRGFAQRVSPLESNRSPPARLPEARNSRIFPRFAPATFAACANTFTASASVVPSGSRKIHGMLVEVSE